VTGGDLSQRLAAVGVLRAAIVIVKQNGTTFGLIAARSKTRSVIRSKHQIQAYLRVVRGLSWNEIGAIFDVDHTTVISGVKSAIRRVRSRTVAA
jgi:chromosomal replication initiation ATPase DnaA